MDTPQYFTTEALIQNHNLDISIFQDDPHYFVFPDIYYHNNQILGLRGYLLSFFTMPLHLVSQQIKSFYNVNNFPKEVMSTNFTYELSITSLFTIFSVLGLMIFWKMATEILHSKHLPTLLVFAFAFGSYIWKYSSTYARHGFLLLLISLSMYSVWKIFQTKYKFRWIFCFFLCWSISFGVDIILFIASTVYIGILLAYIFIKSKRHFSDLYSIAIRHVKKNLIVAGLIIMINVTLNYHWYGTLLFSQTNLQPTIKAVLGEKADAAWVSTPIYPTFLTVLFQAGKIPPESFKNFNNLPKAVGVFTSVDFAKQYNFFGLFIISPFLYFIFLCIFSPKKNKQYYGVLFYCIIVFIFAILGNTKVLNFWGGNQYDVRYFYPYTLLLGTPLLVGLKNIVASSNHIIKVIIFSLFIVSVIVSFVMGWLGVLSMFKPALTGERRVWIDIFDLSEKISSHTFREFLDATFINRQNFWIPILLVLSMYILYTTLLLFWKKYKVW